MLCNPGWCSLSFAIVNRLCGVGGPWLLPWRDSSLPGPSCQSPLLMGESPPGNMIPPGFLALKIKLREGGSLLILLQQQAANFFCTGPDRDHFQFFRPYDFCYTYSTSAVLETKQPWFWCGCVPIKLDRH